jgi:hypothetical protein
MITNRALTQQQKITLEPPRATPRSSMSSTSLSLPTREFIPNTAHATSTAAIVAAM